MDVEIEQATEALRGVQDTEVEQGGRPKSQRKVIERSRTGFIYILGITCGNKDLVRKELIELYKIGKAEDFERRYLEIYSSYARVNPKLPFSICGCRVWECAIEHMNSIESFLHKKLDSNRLDGEWFHITFPEFKKEFGGDFLNVPWPTLAWIGFGVKDAQRGLK